MKPALTAVTLLVCLAVVISTPTSAAGRISMFRGNGWSLTLTASQAPYGSTVQGTLVHGSKRYQVEGDWIPAADEGGDLLRFYGHPFPGQKLLGLVGTATLYNACIPFCAASKTYYLKPLPSFGIPGYTKTRAITLKLIV
jgi:hypothetical protein